VHSEQVLATFDRLAGIEAHPNSSIAPYGAVHLLRKDRLGGKPDQIERRRALSFRFDARCAVGDRPDIISKVSAKARVAQRELG
jgi:hypothetical protein